MGLLQHNFCNLSIMNHQTEKNKMYYLALLENKNCIYHYTIHGLWPDYGDGSYPQYCRKAPFDINKLKPIEDELLQYWELPEDHDKLEPSFWGHEWDKHGTCMFQQMDEFEYFQKSLELYKKVMQLTINIKGYQRVDNSYIIPFDLSFNIMQ